MENKRSFGFRVLISAIKVIIFILLFPYQVVINRKEGRFSVRSLLLHFRIQRRQNEDGKKSADVSLSLPGYDFSALHEKCRKRKAERKKEKKAEKQAAKKAKKQETAEA